MKIKSHFKHNVFMLDEVGDLREHLGGAEDYLLAAELYEVALKRWPNARIQMRQGARVVYDSMRSAVVQDNPLRQHRTALTPVGCPSSGLEPQQ